MTSDFRDFLSFFFILYQDLIQTKNSLHIPTNTLGNFTHFYILFHPPPPLSQAQAPLQSQRTCGMAVLLQATIAPASWGVRGTLRHSTTWDPTPISSLFIAWPRRGVLVQGFWLESEQVGTSVLTDISLITSLVLIENIAQKILFVGELETYPEAYC